MNSKKLHITKIYTVSSILMIAALLLTACSAISFQGQAQPNSNGGITISGGAQAAATIQPLTTTQPENPQPQTTSQPASGNVSTQTWLIILGIIGFVVLVVILVMLIGRGTSRNGPAA